jgi:hypothetical protein
MIPIEGVSNYLAILEYAAPMLPYSSKLTIARLQRVLQDGWQPSRSRLGF